MGSGFFDNDRSLDLVGGLLKVSAKKEFPQRLAEAGLLLWFLQVDGAGFLKALQRDVPQLPKLPKPLFDTLVEFRANPKLAATGGQRSAPVTAVVGSYLTGPRLDLLFDVPGVRPVVQQVAERNAGLVDGVLDPAGSRKLFEAPMASLGVLCVFTELGLRQPVARVERWAQGFKAMVAREPSVTEYWAEVATRVTSACALLREP